MIQCFLSNVAELNSDMWKRCRENGYKALVLTVDTTVQGKREADVKNSMHLPAHLRLENLEKYKKTSSKGELK